MNVLEKITSAPDAINQTAIADAKGEFDRLKKIIESSDDQVELVVDIALSVAEASLPLAMETILLKQIAKKAKTTVAALKQDVQQINKVEASKDEDHLKAAREVVETFGEGNLIACESGLWHWQPSKGYWTKLHDRELKQRIHEVADSSELTSNIVTSIAELAKTEAFVAGHRFNEMGDGIINCKNGRLAIGASDVWSLEPHRREDYCTTIIPVRYDPKASAPRWAKFLDEIFEGAGDAQQRISALQQAFGYTLLPSCRHERFLMLMGSGANGKSVLLSVLSALVGREQVCAVQPSQFENRFQRAHLDGKLANVVTELAEGAEIADAQLKALVSGELTTAEHKYAAPFDFRPIATHWFGTNHLPHTRDFSDALFRRAILIEFPRSFAEHERDVHLTQNLLNELEGIFNWALTGLLSLDQFGFLVPDSSKELAKNWRLEADQVAQWIEQCCTPSQGAFMGSTELYQCYKDWAHKEAGITKTLSQKGFVSRLERLGYKKGRERDRRMIYGIEVMRSHGQNQWNLHKEFDQEMCDG